MSEDNLDFEAKKSIEERIQLLEKQIKSSHSLSKLSVLAAAAAIAFAFTVGPAGPQGPAGPTGKSGPQGPMGQSGSSIQCVDVPVVGMVNSWTSQLRGVNGFGALSRDWSDTTVVTSITANTQWVSRCS
jgi:hypothetical protein